MENKLINFGIRIVYFILKDYIAFPKERSDDINKVNLDVKLKGKTVLMYASEQGDLPVCQLLHSRGAISDVNAKEDIHGRTALMFASERDDVPTCQFLHSIGANVNLQDNEGTTAFYIACEYGYLDVAHFLYSVGADVNISNSRGMTPFMWACERGDLPVARFLHSISNIDVDNAFYIACEQGHLEVAKFLHSIGADVNSTIEIGHTPLHVVAQRQGGNKLPMCKFLHSVGADVNARRHGGITPLMFVGGDFRVARFLYSVGANVNAQDDKGRTPLMWIYNGEFELCKALLLSGADHRITDNDGDTVLDYHLDEDEEEGEVIKSYIKKQASRDIVLTLLSVLHVKRLGTQSPLCVLNKPDLFVHLYTFLELLPKLAAVT
jgi:ankyrin repeat protein